MLIFIPIDLHMPHEKTLHVCMLNNTWTCWGSAHGDVWSYSVDSVFTAYLQNCTSYLPPTPNPTCHFLKHKSYHVITRTNPLMIFHHTLIRTLLSSWPAGSFFPQFLPAFPDSASLAHHTPALCGFFLCCIHLTSCSFSPDSPFPSSRAHFRCHLLKATYLNLSITPYTSNYCLLCPVLYVCMCVCDLSLSEIILFTYLLLA
jgi:hypothetical protein